MRNAFISVAASLAIAALILAPSAGAATEFGDTCASDGIAPGPYTLLTLASPATDLPLVSPAGGVITKVKVKRGSDPVPIAIPVVVKVMRSAGGDSYTNINQTTVQANLDSQTVADARMPVQAGDKLAIHGAAFTYEGTPLEGFTPYCNEVPGLLGAALGDIGVGSTASFPSPAEARVPLAAIVEPDADNDGFGDETQDACPQAAVVQTACPLIAIDTSAKAGKGAVTILVTASSEGLASVKGVVKLGNGKKATLKAKAKTVFAGKLATFRLKFNAKVKKRLKELEPSKKLTLKITASATNVAGLITTDKARVKLKGQG